MPRITPVNRRRNASLEITPKEQHKPGILWLFEGAISVMQRSAISRSTIAIGVCLYPFSRISPQWISSEQTIRWWRLQKADNSANSPASHTRPTGLCGWQSSSNRVSGVTAASIAAKSQPQRLPASLSGTAANLLPDKCGADKNGGYTGVAVITSPSTARHATLRPVTIPGNQTSHSGSTFHPYSRRK